MKKTNEFKSLVERQTFLDVVNKTLEVAECCVTLVAMIDIFLNTELLSVRIPPMPRRISCSGGFRYHHHIERV